MAYAIGVDMGGTFVDMILLDKETGQIKIQKAPSTPGEPLKGIMNCFSLLAENLDLQIEDLFQQAEEIIHGTTVVDNAFVSQKLPKVGLITTKGFKWTLPLMRSGLPFTDNLYLAEKVASHEKTAWVPSYLIAEVSERIDYKGREISPLRMEDVENAVDYLIDQGVQSIAVCLLWSFKNPSHEQAIEKFIKEKYPHTFVSISSSVMPIMREYERTVTTLLNSFVGTLLKPYLHTFYDQISIKGYTKPLFLMQSNGGVIATGDQQRPFVFAWNSGPTGGVIGSSYLGDIKNRKNIITLDMGGTTSDVSLILEGKPQMIIRSKIHGYDAVLPILEIVNIGAGGGSVAWIDAGPSLKVGPKSAGADPGPACYGLGGTQPTVTDADVVLGYVNPDYFWGGRIKLHKDLAMKSIAELAQGINMEPIEVAAGIKKICNANMINAIRMVTIEKGHDPRNATMMVFGGAGPTHGAFLMDSLGIDEIIIPYTETVHSAFGFLTSDLRYDFSFTNPLDVPADPAIINDIYENLEQKGWEAVSKDNVPKEKTSFLRFAELRYKGQVWEVMVPVPNGILDEERLLGVVTAFESQYENLYGKGTAWKQSGIEFINFRIEAHGKFDRPPLRKVTEKKSSDSNTIYKGNRDSFFKTAFIKTDVFDGEQINVGMTFTGPAIIEKIGTTIVIPPGKKARVDEFRNIIVYKEGE